MDTLKNEINKFEDMYSKSTSTKVKDTIYRKILDKKDELRGFIDTYHKYNTNNTNVLIDGKFASKKLHESFQKQGINLKQKGVSYKPSDFLRNGKEAFKQDFGGSIKSDTRKIKKTDFNNFQIILIQNNMNKN